MATIEPPSPPSVPSEIRAEMQRKRVTVSALAQQIGVNRRTLANWLAGVHPITIGNLDLIAGALDVTASHLVAEAERRAQ